MSFTFYPILDCDFKGYRESMQTDDKKIYLVDSGLSFNLPFPIALRPQREIELYITFDFSSRKTDCTPPFRVSINTYFGKILTRNYKYK
jgi:hypothetical protein